MAELKYKTASHTSQIFTGEPWTKVNQLIDPANTIIITDSNVKHFYGKDFPDCLVLTLSPGETSKNLRTVEHILKQLLKQDFDRSGFILGIGGGVVCDIAGFVASVYMRGVSFGFVSTTLLSQVDASIGGKNGVNLAKIKNVVGCFAQPDFVICDQVMLQTLPEDEYISGLGEVIKHALIRDADLFDLLEDNISFIQKRDAGLLDRLITGSILIKKEIVEADEKETGPRRLLNFGHTVGHAIEAVSGIKHGYAIAYGMEVAAQLSIEDGLLDPGHLQRIRGLLAEVNLLPGVKVSDNQLISALMKDKKRDREKIHFVFLEDIGKAVVKQIPVTGLLEKLKERLF
ncbi:MAG TPA: 3-dehydroquinate synthase [Bacteroidales bacterium]|nr:3-dehydroquinate synthase [Bacteroidales bacterium]